MHAANQDYAGFYEEEIMYRTFSSYPPVCKMLMVMVTGKEEKRVEQAAEAMAACARDFSEDTIIVGPAPAGISKINDIYRQIFMIKAKEEELLIGIKDLLEGHPQWKNEKDISVMFDFNPVNPY
jgi:primosomal protein N' (replication factor Y)